MPAWVCLLDACQNEKQQVSAILLFWLSASAHLRTKARPSPLLLQTMRKCGPYWMPARAMSK
jgi:hypothetical protein